MAGDGGVQEAVVDAVGVNVVAHDLSAVVHAVGVSLGRAWRVEAGIDSVDVRKSMNAIRVEVSAHDFASSLIPYAMVAVLPGTLIG